MNWGMLPAGLTGPDARKQHFETIFGSYLKGAPTPPVSRAEWVAHFAPPPNRDSVGRTSEHAADEAALVAAAEPAVVFSSRRAATFACCGAGVALLLLLIPNVLRYTVAASSETATDASGEAIILNYQRRQRLLQAALSDPCRVPGPVDGNLLLPPSPTQIVVGPDLPGATSKPIQRSDAGRSLSSAPQSISPSAPATGPMDLASRIEAGVVLVVADEFRRLRIFHLVRADRHKPACHGGRIRRSGGEQEGRNPTRQSHWAWRRRRDTGLLALAGCSTRRCHPVRVRSACGSSVASDCRGFPRPVSGDGPGVPATEERRSGCGERSVAYLPVWSGQSSSATSGGRNHTRPSQRRNLTRQFRRSSCGLLRTGDWREHVPALRSSAGCDGPLRIGRGWLEEVPPTVRRPPKPRWRSVHAASGSASRIRPVLSDPVSEILHP